MLDVRPQGKHDFPRSDRADWPVQTLPEISGENQAGLSQRQATMHIPDGFLDLKTSVAADALSAGALGLGVARRAAHAQPAPVPLLGLAAAFIFAGQMLNFPVAGGTSGHLVGSVLAAALLGPGAAVIALTAVLVVQCFVFADGGVLALGANVFNMGVVGALVGYALYRTVHRQFGGGLRGAVAAAAFASWVSTVLAAVCCAGMLAVSGTVPWHVAFPAMAGVHMLIGVGEALITALVLVAVGQSHPELLYAPARSGGEEQQLPDADGLRPDRGGRAGALFVTVCQQIAGWPGPRGRGTRFRQSGAEYSGPRTRRSRNT